ncbi:MAG TPA: glycosyltransferase family 2 protein, partial [Chitinophagaceae bacterium]
GTLPRGNTKKTYLNFRNNQIMLAKNLPWSQKWWKIPYRILLDIISATKGLLIGDGGYFIAIFRAHLSFVKWILLKQHKSTFSKRKNKDFKGVYHHNLVWAHFIKGKTFFSQVIKNRF